METQNSEVRINTLQKVIEHDSGYVTPHGEKTPQNSIEKADRQVMMKMYQFEKQKVKPFNDKEIILSHHTSQKQSIMT